MLVLKQPARVYTQTKNVHCTCTYIHVRTCTCTLFVVHVILKYMYMYMYTGTCTLKMCTLILHVPTTVPLWWRGGSTGWLLQPVLC